MQYTRQVYIQEQVLRKPSLLNSPQGWGVHYLHSSKKSILAPMAPPFSWQQWWELLKSIFFHPKSCVQFWTLTVRKTLRCWSRSRERQRSWGRVWNTSLVRSSWVFGLEKKHRLRSNFIALYNSLKDIVARQGLASSHKQLAIQWGKWPQAVPREFQVGYQEKFLHWKCGKGLEKASQWGGWITIPGSVKKTSTLHHLEVSFQTLMILWLPPAALCPANRPSTAPAGLLLQKAKTKGLWLFPLNYRQVFYQVFTTNHTFNLALLLFRTKP